MNQLTHLSRMAVISIMIFTSMMALADDALIVQSGMGERIDHHLSEMEAVGFSGAIVVMPEGEVVLRKGYGYGWSIRQSPYGVMINHRGSNGVFSSEYVWLPDQGVFFYIQGNSTEVPALEMRPHLLKAAFDKE